MSVKDVALIVGTGLIIYGCWLYDARAIPLVLGSLLLYGVRFGILHARGGA